MCEILLLKKNNKKLFFEKTAISSALFANNDGAGYAIFKKNKNKTFEIVEIKHFETEKYTYEKLQPIKTTRTNTKIYTDFEFNHKDSQVILNTTIGDQLILNYPITTQISQKTNYYEKKAALEKWLDTTKIEYNFAYQQDDFNKDIFALYNKKSNTTTKKTPNQIIVDTLFQKQMELKDNELIIMHFRTATSGLSHNFTQPIVGNDFITIHNGIFSGLGGTNISDTQEFTNNLEKLYNLTNLKTKKEEGKFIQTFLDITQGYYSAFIYSLKTKQLYYFKDGASFYSYAKNTMYSTKSERFPDSALSTNRFI